MQTTKGIDHSCLIGLRNILCISWLLIRYEDKIHSISPIFCFVLNCLDYTKTTCKFYRDQDCFGVTCDCFAYLKFKTKAVLIINNCCDKYSCNNCAIIFCNVCPPIRTKQIYSTVDFNVYCNRQLIVLFEECFAFKFRQKLKMNLEFRISFVSLIVVCTTFLFRGFGLRN